MTPAAPVLAGGALLVCAYLTGVVRRVAIGRGLLDVPNVRSSHAVATPRGGGLAIVVTVTASLALLGLTGQITPHLLWALLGGGGVVAAIGLADDQRSVPATARLAVHLGASLWALYCLGGLPSLTLGSTTLQLGWVGNLLAALAITWTLNLFNFMDGIDGIAASEAVFITWGALPCMALLGVAADVSAVSLIVGAAASGFLLWNWPPAKIFLGDVGSGYLGFVVAVLALAASHTHPSALWIWVILGSAFLVDSTVTLLRRVLRGERAHQAHRSHAYQWLARRWGHRRVTVGILLVDLLWLFPGALVASWRPAQAPLTLTVALPPLIALAVWAGAGRREELGPQT